MKWLVVLEIAFDIALEVERILEVDVEKRWSV